SRRFRSRRPSGFVGSRAASSPNDNHFGEQKSRRIISFKASQQLWLARERSHDFAREHAVSITISHERRIESAMTADILQEIRSATCRVRSLIAHFHNGVLHVAQLILAEEHLLSHKEGRSAESTAVHGVLRQLQQPALDILLLCARKQTIEVDVR